MSEKFNQTKYIIDYQRKNVKTIRVGLNRQHDADLIAWVEQQGNASGYIKGLIRADMEQKAERG